MRKRRPVSRDADAARAVRPRAAVSARVRRPAPAAAERPSLAWLVAGDRSGAFGRSLAFACVGAITWAIGLQLAQDWLARDGAVPAAVAERLLLDVETGSAHRFADLAGKLPTRWTVPEPARRAIRDAAGTVGVDAGYLFAVAALESNFDHAARAPGTTAAGLYQFTEETWLRVVKVFGPRHGLAALASEIAVGEDGGVALPQAAARKTLMGLRGDPEIAALMAAELALDNKLRLERVLGRAVSPAEIYMAHFLGVSQAARIIDAAYSRPQIPGARILPAAAQTNPGIFGPAHDPVSAGVIVARIEAYFRDEVPRFAGT